MRNLEKRTFSDKIVIGTLCTVFSSFEVVDGKWRFSNGKATIQYPHVIDNNFYFRYPDGNTAERTVARGDADETGTIR